MRKKTILDVLCNKLLREGMTQAQVTELDRVSMASFKLVINVAFGLLFAQLVVLIIMDFSITL